MKRHIQITGVIVSGIRDSEVVYYMGGGAWCSNRKKAEILDPVDAARLLMRRSEVSRRKCHPARRK